MREHWLLRDDVVFLNHGSFGGCPRIVLAEQQRLREHIEREPVRFFMTELEARLDEARREVAPYLGCDADDLAFVSNASSGVSTVAASLELSSGDELLTTSHEYNACNNALLRAATRRGAQVVVAEVPFPLRSPGEVLEAVLRRVTPRTRLVMISHVTSPTGLVFPVADVVRELGARGVDTLVDGAHAPGMLELHLDALGAAYYVGNFHKWICAPRGAAFLHVRRDKQAAIAPLVTGHGMNSSRTDRSRFRLEHDWHAAADPTPFLCVPAAYRFLEGLVPGGLTAVMRENRALALRGRKILLDALGQSAAAPEEMIGSLAAVSLPPTGKTATGMLDPLHGELLERYAIQVPVFRWPKGRLLRISAQRYNHVGEYERLASALLELGAARPAQA